MKARHAVGQEEEFARSSNEHMDKADVLSIISYEDEMYQLKRQNEEDEPDKESIMGRKSINEVMHVQYYGRTSADEQENESDEDREIDIERDWEGVNDIDNDFDIDIDFDIDNDNEEVQEQEQEQEEEQEEGQEQEDYEDDIEITEIEGFGEEGLMLIIIEIIKSLILNNQQGNNMIVFETEFIDNILKLLNNNPLILIKSYNLSPILYLIKQLSFDQKRKLIQKGIVPVMLKMLTSDDEDVVFIARRILDGLFSIGMEYLQGGEQHPLRQHLAYDGAIDELIKYFMEVGQGDDKQQIREAIAQIIASLYKAFPLHQDSGPEIINQLKSSNNNSQQQLRYDS
ncbi:MAG: hypothetical protein EZS28_045829 [Streblomastix strix]|uniref:Uncharacterized protein n=1 Tax=Streblomastix strix TaxID=222440 RepID=A0A5J4TJV1_9EUKA|nr:MAG: hypothetical protein EZS28_045829 [Streblomastix strix]